MTRQEIETMAATFSDEVHRINKHHHRKAVVVWAKPWRGLPARFVFRREDSYDASSDDPEGWRTVGLYDANHNPVDLLEDLVVWVEENQKVRLS